MKVIVAGVDYAPRPHIVSFLARAFKSLGCEVVRVGHTANTAAGDGDTYTDPCFEPPVTKFGDSMVGLSEVVKAVGGADLAVCVDQGDRWAVCNDGTIPFAYVWRECNPGEDSRVLTASAGGPLFTCMTGKGKINPTGSIPFPFAVDREVFLDPPYRPYKDRFDQVMYSGRERGAGTNDRFRRAFNDKASMHGYIQGYDKYAAHLRNAFSTWVMDTARYVGSRGIEAMASGCVIFADAKADEGAWGWLGLEDGEHYIKIDTALCPSTKEYVPLAGFEHQILELTGDKDRWCRISLQGRQAIAERHTYEQRARLVCRTLGLKLP